MTLLNFSIITPAYHQAQYIEATIQSVLAQNYPRLDYLVVDGGSTDGTLDILRRYENRLRWLSEPDRGQADAINKGFKQTTGDIVAWLNSDDLYLPGVLTQVAEFFYQHPEIDIVYGDYHLIDPTGRLLLTRREIPFDYNILLYGLNYIGQPTVFFRRHVFDRAGYLDENLYYGLDWEYWLRLATCGCKFAHIPHFLAATRWQPQAKTLVAPPQMYAEHQVIRDRYWQKHRFQAARLQKIYTVWLNKLYRGKRQALKVILRHTLDLYPADWLMYQQKKV
jgi:glycosyltransferase involved in cell wall biosynthesis